MSDILIITLVFMSIFILAFIWAGLTLSWLIKKQREDAQRSLDCLMVLVSERKAVIAAQTSHARHIAENPPMSKDEIEEYQTTLDAENEKLRIFDEVQASGIITPEQEKILNG